MPVPAAEVRPLAGKRVVMCDADQGIWVYGQWAVTEPHDRDGETVVGLLDSADWYRRKRDPEHVIVPRSHPLSGLWVELPQDVGNVSPIPPDQSDVRPAFRTKSIVADLSRPPVRWLRFSQFETEVNGSRCWVLTPSGASPAWRACGEPRRKVYSTIDLTDGLDGLDKPVVGTVVPVCLEEEWYQWRQTGQPPRLRRIPTQLVWLE
jgi:hypothetical protein